MYGYVYKTTNKINNKVYIGQHKSEIFDFKYYGSGKILKMAINKYGIDNFVCEILEWCETKTDLDNREKYWINIYDSKSKDIGYNITSGGEGFSCNHTDETKKKMSLSRKGNHKTDEWKVNLSKSLCGHYVSDETRLKISQANKGRKRTDEQRKMLSNSLIGHKVADTTILKLKERTCKPVVCYSVDGEYIKRYDSIVEAERDTGINRSSISLCCNNKRKTVGNLIWKFEKLG